MLAGTLVCLVVPIAGRDDAAWSAHPVLAAQSAQSADSVRLLFSEVLFAPAAGDTAFAELLNAGSKPVNLTAAVLRVDTLVLALPRLSAPLAPGAHVLIRFDGRGTLDEGVIHAAAGFELDAAGRTLELTRNDGFQLDRVAWGTAPGATTLSGGGVSAERFEPGSSIGRPPGSTRATPWVTYAREQVTPGKRNPPVPVAQLLPLDGAILEEEAFELGWYPAPGAARYRVQLAADSAFTRPVFDQTVEEPSVTPPTLPLGVYWWRVQAIPAEGTGEVAPWSRTSRLERAAPAAAGTPPGFAFGGWEEGEGVGNVSRSRMLVVPYITQHKDSPMLLIESTTEKGPHAWNVDHRMPLRTDPADTHNCAAANVAMINRFYGGDLSQDRISYEVLSRNVLRYRSAIAASPLAFALTDPLFAAHAREREPGPERDLSYGDGLETLRVFAAFTYALGAPPDFKGAYASWDEMWDDVRREIDAGRPLVGANSHHAFVIRGYALRNGHRTISVSDPANGRYTVDLDASRIPPGDFSSFTFPNRGRIARQEPEVTKDSDGDGVVDFDEVQRFRTSPGNVDSDADGVHDRQDIEAGVFEKEFQLGYAYSPGPNSIGRDYDRDGLATELDPDSDEGGCKDGDEDRNGDGVHGGSSETSNFIRTDDICENLSGSISYEITAVNPTNQSIVKEVHDQGTMQLRFKPDTTLGPGHYADAASTFTYQGYARTEVDLGSCMLWSYEEAHGGGTFSGPDFDIGGYRADDGTMVVGARVAVPGTASGGACGVAGGTAPSERGFSLPDCTGVYRQMSGTRREYRFDCTTRPNLGLGWQILTWYVRGWVRVR